MRWKITKAAWNMAKKLFPSTKRIYVEIPARFASNGECKIIDLESPDKPLGYIPYAVAFDGGCASVILGTAKTVSIPMPRSASIEFQVPAAPWAKERAVVAADISPNYQDQETLAQEVARLAAWHSEGPEKDGASIKEADLHKWLSECGFPGSISEPVERGLSSLGFSVEKQPKFNARAAKKREPRFFDYQKVRVVDPRIMDHNEGARILDRHRDGEDSDWYLVIVDGSEKPIWLNERQLEPNKAGMVAGSEPAGGENGPA
jgi:hypothetical protein